MEENSIPRKPIHIGIIISRDLWDDKDINVILTYNHKLKYFFSEQYKFSANNYIYFQYKEEEIDEVTFIGNLDDFPILEDDPYYLDEEPGTGIIKCDFGRDRFYKYYVSADVIIKTHTVGGFTEMEESFTDEENVLLDYIYKERYVLPTEEEFIAKKKEIEDYVNSLDIDKIIDSYHIGIDETIIPRKDKIFIFAYGDKCAKPDIYLDRLLPDSFGTLYAGDDAFIPDDLGDGSITSQEPELKQKAKETYTKEKHIGALLYSYMKNIIGLCEQSRKQIDSPKEILWSTTDLDTASVIDTLRFNVDKLKIIKDYNEGKYNRDNNPSFYYEKK